MSSGNGSGAGGWPPPEQLRAHTESTLTQVMAAGEVARAMWQLLMADHRRQRVAQVEPGQWRAGMLPQSAIETTRDVIDTCLQREETALDVYVLAALAGAVASTRDPDWAALALVDLASLHRHIGYPEDALNLLEVADNHGVSERIRHVLATIRTQATEATTRSSTGDDIPQQ